MESRAKNFGSRMEQPMEQRSSKISKREPEAQKRTFLAVLGTIYFWPLRPMQQALNCGSQTALKLEQHWLKTLIMAAMTPIHVTLSRLDRIFISQLMTAMGAKYGSRMERP